MKSMTGYGRFEQQLSGYNIIAEIKSVNHRYFTFSPRIPRVYNHLEDKIKKLVHQTVQRGEIDLYLSIRSTEKSDTVVEINKALAGAYLQQLQNLGQALGLTDDLALSDMIKFGDIFSLSTSQTDEDLIWSIAQGTIAQAIEQFEAMRKAEGGQLKEDITSRIAYIESMVAQVEEISTETLKAWQVRLYDKIKEVLDDKQIDEARIITEAAIFANKIAVDEETVRLHSHMAQFKDIINENQPVGRKLDFLVQEINREVNTIGSKCQDAQGAKLVVEIKSEVEKIREQIQNIE